MPFVPISMSKHHTDLRPFRIYALVLDRDIFVGKTSSPRISAVYSRHRCSDVAATRGVLDQKESPSLHVLEELTCTGSEAYRHVLAWLHWFEAAGYCSINHARTAVSSEELYPPTEKIIRQLPLLPVEQILARTCLEKPSDGNRKPPRKFPLLLQPEKQVQMNLRMAERDKKRFDQFCKKNGLKSREALGLLLDQISQNHTHLDQLLADQKALRQENEALKDRLAVQQEQVLSPKERQMEAYLHFLKPIIAAYIRLIVPQEEDRSLPTLPYKRFQKKTTAHYEYPEEGILVLTAEALLWGRNRARFLVGHGEDGKFRKIRYYPKETFTGALPWDYRSGTRWLIGCRQASDGAMEIAAAFPLPPKKAEAEAPPEKESSPKASLDDLISQAKGR